MLRSHPFFKALPCPHCLGEMRYCWWCPEAASPEDAGVEADDGTTVSIPVASKLGVGMGLGPQNDVSIRLVVIILPVERTVDAAEVPEALRERPLPPRTPVKNRKCDNLQ